MADRDDLYDRGGNGSPYAPPSQTANPGFEWQWDGREWVQVPTVAPPQGEDPPLETVMTGPGDDILIDQVAAQPEVAPPVVDPYTGAPEQSYSNPYIPDAGGNLNVQAAGPLLTDPPATSGGSGPTGGGQAGGGSFFTPWTPPAFQQPGNFAGYPEFSYESFRAPSLEEAQSEPGYEFAAREGRRALENSAAAKGILRTGGTLKDILGWGNRFAEQNYGNVFNRKAQTWGMNRENAADAFVKNYGVARDTWSGNTDNAYRGYDQTYRGGYDAFNAGRRGEEMTFEDLYRRWRDQLDTQTQLATMQLPDEEYV